MLVLASKPAGLAPNQRFRFEQWAPHLARDHGIDLDLDPFESVRLTEILYRPGHTLEKALLVARDFIRRGKSVERVRSYDAVVIAREAALIGPAIYERAIAATGVPMIFDFDDAIWKHQPGSSLIARLHFVGKIRTSLRLSAAVSAGNQYLAGYARDFNRNVAIVPTTIELNDYPVAPEPDDADGFIVCWTGSTSTLRHFALARGALERVARHTRLIVKVICNEPPAEPIKGAEMQFVPWKADSEAREIGACHAAIMPLPDDEFARGKCGLKALQSMATGRPVVASPVGVNCEMIEHGKNGFLAASDKQFAEILLGLAGDAKVRESVGKAGRQTVEARYSAEHGAFLFAEVIRSAIAGHQNG